MRDDQAEMRMHDSDKGPELSGEQTGPAEITQRGLDQNIIRLHELLQVGKQLQGVKVTE